MSHEVNRDGRLARLYLAHSTESVKIAQLLCGDQNDATAVANSAFVKSIASFRDLRNPLTFEASLRRSIIRECRPPLRARVRAFANSRPSASQEGSNEDALSAGFEGLSHRKKAALVLRYFEGLSDDQVADVLGCSTGTARSLVNKALTELQGTTSSGANPARVAGEVVRLFARRSAGTKVSLEPDQRVLKRATIRRRLTVGAILTVVAVSIVVVVIVATDAGSNLSL